MLIVLPLWAARPAEAEERELQVAVEPRYGFLVSGERSGSGGGGAVQVAYGLTDAVSLQVTGGVTAHPLDAPVQGPSATTALGWYASAGVVYAIDIVRVVPFFEATLGVLGVNEPG